MKMLRADKKPGREGFTLVELMITLAILLIFITVSYTFFSYISRSFDAAQKQSEIQENTILAKKYIDEKVRNASYIAVLGSGDTAPATGWNQSFYTVNDGGNGRIMHYTTADAKETDMLGGLTDGYNMKLSFKKVGTSFLEISVTCEVSGYKPYTLVSQVLILGIETDKLADLTHGGSGVRICFMASTG